MLPLIGVGLCIVLVWSHIQSWALLGMVMIPLWYYSLPGSKWASKLDHYLRLDGRLLSGGIYPWLPGHDFLRHRQMGLSGISLMLLLLLWAMGQDGVSFDDSEGQEISVGKAFVVDDVNKSFEDSSREGNVASSRGASLGRVGVNVKGDVLRVSKAVSSDEAYFFSKQWPVTLPYHWLRK